jgi:DNA-binding response OmpR family regulator
MSQWKNFTAAASAPAGQGRGRRGGPLEQQEGEEVHLTPTEWSVLDLLVRNRGSLVSCKQLLREIWGPVERKETSYLRV